MTTECKDDNWGHLASGSEAEPPWVSRRCTSSGARPPLARTFPRGASLAASQRTTARAAAARRCRRRAGAGTLSPLRLMAGNRHRRPRCLDLAHVSPWTIHFGVLDKNPVLGPGRGPPSCNKWQLWQVSAATDILTTWGTQGPACPLMDQTQRLQLGLFCPWSPPDTDNWPERPNREDLISTDGQMSELVMTRVRIYFLIST
ncbi:uncharacterized protein LOC122425533 [Cervus canadensis]|uniref:uncharacterized protein LOC122425533 n=1 Tax=Cervus canadensis TaxID=1574408 RepID=UPI001CA386B7|nr:uncharacterized protein LOC122425533 [Cervus canadensis]